MATSSEVDRQIGSTPIDPNGTEPRRNGLRMHGPKPRRENGHIQNVSRPTIRVYSVSAGQAGNGMASP